MIYWVNSFQNPYCLLASSSTDFKDGIIFCELVSILKAVPTFPGVSQAIPPSAETSMNNISLALSELQSCNFISFPSRLAKLSPDDIYNSEEAMYDFLNILKMAFEGGLKKEEIKNESPVQETKPEANFPLSTPKIPKEENIQIQQQQNLKDSINNKKKPPRMPSTIQSEQKQKQVVYCIDEPKSTKSVSQKGTSIARNEKQMDNCLSRGIMVEGPKESYAFAISTGPCFSETALEHTTDINQETRARQFSGIRSVGQISQKSTPRVPSSRSANLQPMTEQQSKPSSREKILINEEMPLQMDEKKTPQKYSQITHTPNRENKLTYDSQHKKTQIDIKTKHKVLEWLEEIHLIKQNAATIADFPGYCRNGVLLADLIMRLEGVYFNIFIFRENLHLKE